MTVERAEKIIDDITRICNEINGFEEKHEELSRETGFLSDAIGYLCDYRHVIEKGIKKAEVIL